jgi:vacuolar-type H+-ATPase subunit D/Vma8
MQNAVELSKTSIQGVQIPVFHCRHQSANTSKRQFAFLRVLAELEPVLIIAQPSSHS